MDIGTVTNDRGRFIYYFAMWFFVDTAGDTIRKIYIRHQELRDIKL